MKTCFLHGYPNKPVKKHYYYHGMLRECPIQPGPEGFMCVDTKKPGPGWEVIYERWNTTSQTYTLDYDLIAFKPGSGFDTCSVKFPDGKVRFYFCELEIWDGTFFIGWAMDLSGIISCSVTSKAGVWSYFYKSYVARVWAEKSWLVYIFQWIPNSHFKIWRSTDGNLPVDYPVPIQEYYIP